MLYSDDELTYLRFHFLILYKKIKVFGVRKGLRGRWEPATLDPFTGERCQAALGACAVAQAPRHVPLQQKEASQQRGQCGGRPCEGQRTTRAGISPIGPSSGPRQKSQRPVRSGNAEPAQTLEFTAAGPPLPEASLCGRRAGVRAVWAGVRSLCHSSDAPWLGAQIAFCVLPRQEALSNSSPSPQEPRPLTASVAKKGVFSKTPKMAQRVGIFTTFLTCKSLSHPSWRI